MLFCFSSEKQPSLQVQEPPKPIILTSDPIVPFSSPTRKTESSSLENDGEPPRTKVSQETSLHDNLRDKHDSDEDSDLPEISESLMKDLKKKELFKMKKRALEQQKWTVSNDDDDDLEIVDSNPKVVVKEEEEHRRSARKRPSEGRKRQLHFAKINPAKQSAKGLSAVSPGRRIQGEISSYFSRHAEVGMDQKELNMLLATEAKKRALDTTRRKEEEWRRHGGRVRSNPDGQRDGLAVVLKTVAEKVLDAAEATRNDEEGGDDPSDGDWEPDLRGSASSEPAEDEEENEGEDDDEKSRSDEDMAIDDDLEAQVQNKSKVRGQRRKVVALDSESGEENDENAPAPTNILSNRSTSRDLQTEEEDDKENNTQLMYDHSENKENTAVVRHRPMAINSHLSYESVTFSPPMSPNLAGGSRGTSNHGTELSDQTSGGSRQPFQELTSEDSPLPSQIQPSNLTQTFAERLQQASPVPRTLTPAPTLKPFLNTAVSSSKSFTAIPLALEGEGDVFGTQTLLPSSFSDLFESTTQNQRSPTRLNKAVWHVLLWVVFTSYSNHVSQGRRLEGTEAYRYARAYAGYCKSSPTCFRGGGDFAPKS